MSLSLCGFGSLALIRMLFIMVSESSSFLTNGFRITLFASVVLALEPLPLAFPWELFSRVPFPCDKLDIKSCYYGVARDESPLLILKSDLPVLKNLRSSSGPGVFVLELTSRMPQILFDDAVTVTSILRKAQVSE